VAHEKRRRCIAQGPLDRFFRVMSTKSTKKLNENQARPEKGLTKEQTTQATTKYYFPSFTESITRREIIRNSIGSVAVEFNERRVQW
jgi:hypothetical protein